jgi:hypothetical protein
MDLLIGINLITLYVIILNSALCILKCSYFNFLVIFSMLTIKYIFIAFENVKKLKKKMLLKFLLKVNIKLMQQNLPNKVQNKVFGSFILSCKVKKFSTLSYSSNSTKVSYLSQ